MIPFRSSSFSTHWPPKDRFSIAFPNSASLPGALTELTRDRAFGLSAGGGNVGGKSRGLSLAGLPGALLAAAAIRASISAPERSVWLPLWYVILPISEGMSKMHTLGDSLSSFCLALAPDFSSTFFTLAGFSGALLSGALTFGVSEVNGDGDFNSSSTRSFTSS